MRRGGRRVVGRGGGEDGYAGAGRPLLGAGEGFTAWRAAVVELGWFGPPSVACPRNGGWWKCERVGRPKARTGSTPV